MAQPDTMQTGTGVPGSNLGIGPAGSPNTNVIDRRHAEWRTHQLRWRWLLDSWEGGEAYRQAIYGWDLTGLPVRNLIRHKREYPDPREQNYYGVLGRPPGSDMAAQATNDDYEMRRARTPVPTCLPDVIHRHTSKIYSQTPKRKGPPDLLQWFEDVDGSCTTMREWMRDTISILLLIFGHIDVLMERPPVEKSQRSKIKTRADEIAAGLDCVVASYILPQNLVWWDLNRRGQYRKVLICEPQEEKGPTYRYWEEDKWTLFDVNGEIVDEGDHPYNRPPIVRLFDRRRLQAKNIGLPRYDMVAETQREIYNRASELVLSDSTQAHPLIQGPEDYCQADTSIPMGIGWLLPKKKNSQGSDVSYEGFDVIEFPKGSADSLRSNIHDLRDDVDRSALLTKPAGAKGTNGSTVSQSGVSKRMDHEDGNVYLTEIAAILQKAERQIVELYYLVAGNGVPDQAKIDQVEICYPTDFDLFGPEEFADLVTDWFAARDGAGGTPTIDAALLKRYLRMVMLGASDAQFAVFDAEIDAYMEAAAALRGQQGELPMVHPERRDVQVGENMAGTESEPDSINAESLASAGVLVNEVY